MASPPFLGCSHLPRPFLAQLKLLCNLGLPTTYSPLQRRVESLYLLVLPELIITARSLNILMRLIAFLPIALAVSASALAFERDLGDNARRDPNPDPQTSLSKCNESSLSSRRLYFPSSVGSTGHFHKF
jgi:hypothetical protein